MLSRASLAVELLLILDPLEADLLEAVTEVALPSLEAVMEAALPSLEAFPEVVLLSLAALLEALEAAPLAVDPLPLAHLAVALLEAVEALEAAAEAAVVLALLPLGLIMRNVQTTGTLACTSLTTNSISPPYLLGTELARRHLDT